MSAEPAAQANPFRDRLFALLPDCRALVPQLGAARTEREPVSAQTERLVGAIEAGLGPDRGGCPDRAAPGEPAAWADGGGVAEAAGAEL
jgi:hypothetical protein